MFMRSFFFVLLFVSGCTASSSIDYTGVETDETVENQLTVNEDFEIVWDRLIKNLSSEFFVINNVEKASRIINVSFSSNTPSDLIDCGRTSRTYTSGSGATESYNYLSADSSRFKYSTEDGLYAYDVATQKSVEGRANIYVAPTDQGTQIAVNVRYIWTTKFEFMPIHRVSGVVIGYPESRTDEYTFETANPLDEYVDGFQLTCRSNGTLESMVLDAAVSD